MLNVKIDAPLDEAIARQAKRERKTRPALVRRAVEHYLEYVADVREVAAVKRRREKSVSWSKVKTELGLWRPAQGKCPQNPGPSGPAGSTSHRQVHR